MSDPLSVCASILAITAAAQGSIEGLRKIKGYWKAPAAVDEIVVGIENLQSTLHDVALFLERTNSSLYSESLRQPVHHASSIIQSINSLLSSAPFHLTRLSKENHRRTVWLRHGRDIKDFLENLKLVRLDLMLKLGVLTVSSTTQIHEAVSISIGMQDTISQQLSVIINREPQVNPGMALLEETAASATMGEHLHATGHVTEVVEDAVPIDGSEESCHDALSQPEERASLSANNQRQCVPWCSCRCHVRQSWKSPWVLETLIGRIQVSYSGKMPDCNEMKCLRTSTAAPFTVTHQLPRYLMNRYLFLSMRYTPRDGPTFALRAPKITPWSHMFWNYANSGDLQAIQRMFAQGKASPFDLNPHGSNVLFLSAAQKDCRLTKFMIEQGADPNLSDGVGRAATSRLWDYSFSGRYGDEGISIVTNMLKDTDYTETRGFSTLHKIVLGINARDIHDLLEDSTASVNVGDARGRTPLHWATIRDDLSSVKALLAAGADPNVTDRSGTSSLGYVISSAVCSMLLEAGARTDIRNNDYDQTALHIHCCSYGEVEVVDLLLQAGISVNVRTADDETPLIAAIYWHFTPAAKRLIELGADVNAKNISSRDNTLHIAVNYDHWEIIPLLLAKRVDYKASNIRRRNIAHMAAISGSTATMDTLARSNLAGLDFELKDVDGKTPADHMREREIFAEKEKGVFEAFEALRGSVKVSDAVVEQVEKP